MATRPSATSPLRAHRGSLTTPSATPPSTPDRPDTGTVRQRTEARRAAPAAAVGLPAMRFGIIGLGWAAGAFHLPALKTVPGAVVVGGCDLSEEQRASFASASGLPAYGSVGELLEQGRPDVVVVATPPDSHRALCLEALEGGVHVICEKPFVETVADADVVIAA